MRVICIDGPAGVGKSTVARRLAESEGLAYLDSGAMYRALTVVALRRGISLEEPAALAAVASGLQLVLERDGRVRVDGEDVTSLLRTETVNQAVSLVAQVPEVREVMVRHQRAFARRYERVVAEGRDMGTVVFPDGEVKIYLDADPRERIRRRVDQVRAEPTPDPEAVQDEAEIGRGLERRDRIDSTRAVAPLKPAPDAWRLDTTDMTLDEVIAAVRAKVRSAT